MDAEQKYGFDVWGFLHLEGTLAADVLQGCDGNRLESLLEHRLLNEHLHTILGDEFTVDHQPAMVHGDDPGSPVELDAGDGERNRRLRYIRIPYAPVCHGVRVICALADLAPDHSLVVVPASHKRCFDPPADLLGGVDDIGMTLELPLKAGDVVVLAATTLFGIRGNQGRLAKTEYVSQPVMPSGGYPQVEGPEWVRELTPAQQAIVGPRTTGSGGHVISDGIRSELAEYTEETPTADFGLNGGSAPDPKELFFWDVRGYLPLRNMIAEEWLAAAHAAIDAAIEAQPTLPDGHLSKFEEVPEAVLRSNGNVWPAETSTRILGEIHRPRIGGLYDLPDPHCDPFRRMIGYPPAVQRLNWMLGTGFKEHFEPMCCIYPTGTTGGSIHGQNISDYAAGARFPLADSLNLVWSLNDEAPGFGENSGGFVCIPGSHKACYDIPRSETTSIDLPQVHKPPLKAGDLLYFGGVAHGTTAWRSTWHRRCVIQFIASRNLRIMPGKLAGWRWSTDQRNPTKRVDEAPSKLR